MSIDEELKSRGMMTTAELLAGSPVDGFVTHAQVKDISSFVKWLDMETACYLDQKARLELDGDDKSEIYEWVLAHYATFNEVRVNLRAALKGE